MTASKVYWKTGTVVGSATTYADFCEQADEAIYEYLYGSEGVNDFVNELQKQLKTYNVSSNPGGLTTTCRSHRPETEPIDGDTAFPLVYIMTRQAGTEYPETGTVVAAFNTDITLFHAHADLKTARTHAQRIANIITSLLQQQWYATANSYTWLNYYCNRMDVLEPETSEVELDYGGERLPVYAVTVSFRWRHYEEISSGY